MVVCLTWLCGTSPTGKMNLGRIDIFFFLKKKMPILFKLAVSVKRVLFSIYQELGSFSSSSSSFSFSIYRHIASDMQ